MGTRLELHEELCSILGSRNVYFQPPPSVEMRYPAIVYTLIDIAVTHADDFPYKFTRAYNVQVIAENPDSDIHERILLHFPMTRFTRFFAMDNLNHWNLTLYY